VPKSGFPAALWVNVWTHQRGMAATRSPKHDRFGRTRLGARLDIREPGQMAGIAYRLQSAWEDPIPTILPWKVNAWREADHDP